SVEKLVEAGHSNMGIGVHLLCAGPDANTYDGEGVPLTQPPGGPARGVRGGSSGGVLGTSFPPRSHTAPSTVWRSRGSRPERGTARTPPSPQPSPTRHPSRRRTGRSGRGPCPGTPP